MPPAKRKSSSGWWREVFSEKGVGSVKRVVGTFISFVSMCCIVYLTITAGPVAIVEDLLQTSLITGASLLGLYSITSIWKNGSMSVGGGGKDISYQGEDSKKVLEDVLKKDEEVDIDEVMVDSERDMDDPHGN